MGQTFTHGTTPEGEPQAVPLGHIPYIDFGSLTSLYENPGAIKSDKLRASLLAAKDTVYRNQQLIRLRDDLPGDHSPEQFVVQSGDNVALYTLYSRWGFNTLRRELEASRLRQTDFLQ